MRGLAISPDGQTLATGDAAGRGIRAMGAALAEDVATSAEINQ